MRREIQQSVTLLCFMHYNNDSVTNLRHMEAFRACPKRPLKGLELAMPALCWPLQPWQAVSPSVGCCHETWWINRPDLSKPISGWFVVMRQSRGAFSSPARFHPSASDSTLPATEPCTRHWLRCPQTETGGKGQASTSRAVHRRRPVPVALRRQLIPSFSRLHERYTQRVMRAYEMVGDSPPLQVRRARAGTPCRTVSFTRSIKAVFNLPEKPNSCKVIVRGASVSRRITYMTRTNLRRREHFSSGR